MPAPSWPRIEGNRPSGSAPESVNSSVWQIPVALISTSASPARGPSSSTVSIASGAPALCATAALTFMNASFELTCGGASILSGMQNAYRGRFAPSPTGPLHFGSLVAAVGSYLDARVNRGAWLVRVEDLDPPRVVRGAADDILRTLEACGMEWEGHVAYQSARADEY